MAVPSAVMKQREKIQADLAAQGLNEMGTPVEQQPTAPLDLDTPISAPPVQQPPQVTTPAPDVNAKIQELEHLLKTRDGQTSAATARENEARQRAEVMASQVASLEEMVATLQKQVERAEARATVKSGELLNLEPPEDLTAEEREKFDGETIGFVEKLTKKELVRVVKPLQEQVQALQKQLELSQFDKIPQLEKTLKTNEVESRKLKEAEFFRKEVLEYFPDFVNARQTQEWKDFLVADIPGKGIKNGHLLEHYKNIDNALGIRTLLQSYFDSVKAKPTLASIATPRGAQTEGMPVVKPKLKASEYQSKLRLFTARRLPRDEWDKFKSEFNTALSENRVDMDVRL